MRADEHGVDSALSRESRPPRSRQRAQDHEGEWLEWKRTRERTTDGVASAGARTGRGKARAGRTERELDRVVKKAAQMGGLFCLQCAAVDQLLNARRGGIRFGLIHRDAMIEIGHSRSYVVHQLRHALQFVVVDVLRL